MGLTFGIFLLSKIYPAALAATYNNRSAYCGDIQKAELIPDSGKYSQDSVLVDFKNPATGYVIKGIEVSPNGGTVRKMQIQAGSTNSQTTTLAAALQQASGRVCLVYPGDEVLPPEAPPTPVAPVKAFFGTADSDILLHIKGNL